MRPGAGLECLLLRIHVGKVGTGLFQLAFKKFGGVSGLLQGGSVDSR